MIIGYEIWQRFAGFLLLALLGMVYGGIDNATHRGRTLIPVAFVFSGLTLIVYSFWASTHVLEPATTIFRWRLTPLWPSLGVYVGLSFAGLLLTALFNEQRSPCGNRLRRAIAGLLTYGSAVAAVGLAVQYPISLQRLIDASFAP